MIDLAKLRAAMTASRLDVRGPLRPVLQDGANPEGGYSWNLADASDMFVCGDTSRREAEAIAAMLDVALLDELDALRVHAADVNHYLRAILDGKPASICSFCHHLSENNPEAMRAHVLACEKHPLRAAVTAWREATGCDGPGEAEQLARDAVVVREGHWDAALAERAAWRTATGCDTPEEMAALALAEARDEGHAAGRAEALCGAPFRQDGEVVCLCSLAHGHAGSHHEVGKDGASVTWSNR